MAVERTLERVRAIIARGADREQERAKERAQERRKAFLGVLAADDLKAVHPQFLEEWGEEGWSREMTLFLRRKEEA